MVDPIYTPTTPIFEDFDNLRQSYPSPPPQYTPRPIPLMQTQTQHTIPHLNFSLSSSPLPSPIYSPGVSHNLTSPYAPNLPFSPYNHPSSPFIPTEHTSFLPFTLSPHRHQSNTSTTSLKLPPRVSSILRRKHEKARRTKLIGIIACVTLLLIALAVGLAVVGVVLGWGKGGYCVRWDDGQSSGDCKEGGS